MRKNFVRVLSPLAAFAVFSVLAVLIILPGTEASADIFYTSSNYNAGMAGIIRGSAQSGYTVEAKLVSNLNGDAQGLSFVDHNGNLRALIRERMSGIGDVVSIYNPQDFRAPILNARGFGANIHAIASGGDDLYLVTYESYPVGPEDTGEVIHVNMKEDYTVKDRYHNERFFYAGFADYAWPHGEGVMVYNGKVYVMFGMSDPSKILDYAPTEIVEFDRGLTPTGKKAVLKDSGTKIGKNSLTMKLYNGKLYVGCIGGRQGPGVHGNIWEVDMADFGSAPARLVLDFEQVTGVLAGAGWGAYGIAFTEGGTAFILAGGYDNSMDFKGRLFKLPADKLAAGGTEAISSLQTAHSFTGASGHSWWDGVTWDAKSDTLWCMAGTHLFAFDRNGAFQRDFTPVELGEDIYSVALFNEPSSSDPGGEPDDPPVDPGDIDEDVEIVPAGNLEIPSGSTVAEALSGLSGLPDISSSDLESKFSISPGGQLTANTWAVERGLPSGESDRLDQATLTPVPVFKAAVSDGKTALVSIRMNFGGTKLAGNSFDKLVLLKLRNSGERTDRLTRADNWAGMAHGTFIITELNGNPASGVIGEREYTVSAAIRDNSSYDWCSEPGIVVDPLVAAIEGGTDYEPGEGGGMPGGCAAGAGAFSAMAALIALAALGLPLYRGKRG
ncbi:MAG: hypothetical protein LBL26_10940 [Peptococcaceae bacterium]|jgi:hypothetical protein|nr:hypothetical protein [Peptococcaceae bacterium]